MARATRIALSAAGELLSLVAVLSTIALFGGIAAALLQPVVNP